MAAKEPIDLFDYILNQIKVAPSNSEYDPVALHFYEDFCKKARKVLAKNLPVAMDTLQSSPGLRLQDSTTLLIVDTGEDQAPPVDQGAIQIANTKVGRDGKGLTAPTESFNITGGDS